MSDSIKIIRDISLLYELSLSVGSSLDPWDNCRHFLRTLISRKSLNFGAVWISQPSDTGEKYCELFCIQPYFRKRDQFISCNQYILKMLAEKPYMSISSNDPYFEELIQEKKVGKGAYALFRLGELGFLKLFASNRLNGFSSMEMEQLQQVVDKLKISLDGCFAHINLKEETESRLVAQKALEESEQKLRRIIDSSMDAVLSTDEHGNTIEWNLQAEKMFGFTREEVFGKPLLHIIIPERFRELYGSNLQDQIQRAQKSSIDKRYQIKCIRKDGSEFLAELSVTADINSPNTLFVGFLRDITEQKSAQQNIEQARVRMENLIASLQAGILLEDNNRQIALVNKAFCDIFQIPIGPEQLIGADCSNAAEQSKHLFDDPEGFVAGIERNLKNKTLVENELLYLRNGRVVERDFIPLFSGDRYQGHLWQYRDITERQTAQQAIRESEEKYRGVLENMELGLLEVDHEDNIIRANNAFCQMLGYQTGELIGKNASKTFLPEASREIIQERLQERKLGLSSVYELQFSKKNGERLWVLISGAPIKNLQGQIIGSIGIHFDMTARKRLEQELAEAKTVADRARLAERQFLTHMSHEIRTPINAVIGLTHHLHETQLDSLQQEYLNSLQFSADSLLGVIDDILDLSKIDAGEIEFEQKSFDLNYLLEALLNSFRFKTEGTNIKLIDEIDSSIENLVVGDSTRLNQILTNLLGNALKFTEKGTISLNTTVLEKSEEVYQIEFRVQDTGIGIPSDKLETIFEYFKQADVQINRKFGGTGLGLTIVKQLIEMQGGTIRVESELGLGSEFVFTLSFGNSGIPLSDHKPTNPQDRPNSNNRIKGLHFLVVEDNQINQKLICKTLQTWKCTYEVASDGLKALKKTAQQKFDIILMDIHMPGLDGCETTLRIRSEKTNPNNQTPIIALTAAAMSDEKRRAFEVGMNGFLTKPIVPKMLQAHLLQYIGSLLPQEAERSSPPESPHATGNSTFDLRYLMDLSSGDQDFVDNMVNAFLTETPIALQELEQVLKQEEWGAVLNIVHRLKPNFGLMGMPILEECAFQIENAIKNQSEDSDQLVKKVHQLILQANAALLLVSQRKLDSN